MVEYFPQILASDDKATTTTIICSLLPFLSLNTEIQPMLGENKTISKQQQHTHKNQKTKQPKMQAEHNLSNCPFKSLCARK